MNIYLTIILTLICAHHASGTERVIKKFQFKGKSVDFAVQLPASFDPSSTYPVMIGPSEVKGNDDQSFYWRGVKDTQGWILVDFAIYDYSNKKAEIQAFLNHLRSTYKVEGNKFHTVCFSANSSAIFSMVMDIPNEFHSISGIAGNPSTRDAEQLKKLQSVKVRFVVGDRDNYWMKAAKSRHEILQKLGIDSQIEIIKNGQHVLKDLIGKQFLERAEKLR